MDLIDLASAQPAVSVCNEPFSHMPLQTYLQTPIRIVVRVGVCVLGGGLQVRATHGR